MSIYYAVITRNDTGNQHILVEHAPKSIRGNFQSETKRVVSRICQKNLYGTMSYETKNNKTFHVINDQFITYLCLTSSDFKQELAHKYLLEVKENFNQTYTR